MRLSLATTQVSRSYPRMTNKAAPSSTDRDRIYGRALSVLRKRARLSQQAAAEALGVTPQAWQNYEAGKRSSIFALSSLPGLTAAVGASSMDLTRVADLIEAGTSEGLLADPDHPLPTGAASGEVVIFSRRKETEPASLEAATLAPVYGAVHAGAPDAIAFTPDHPDDWRPLHPNQVGYRDPFYVEVIGDSMSPRFEPGEKAPAVRGVWPSRGQVCVVETHQGAMLLKYYERRDAESLYLRELSPQPREFAIHLADVRAVHAVVGGAVS